MPIIECKTCKGQVSSEAKSCPHCGAKVPKQVGLLVGIFATLFVGFFIYESTRVESTSTTSSSNVPSVSSVNEANVPPEKPPSSWSVINSVDEMTGKKSFFAVSESVAPTRPLGFPYSDVTAWMGVGCEGASEWAFFGFDQAPNLTDTETQSGYNAISTRIKWGDSVENVQLNQDWGSSYISFVHHKAAIGKIIGSSSVMLELNWYGEGSTNFVFPMAGSSAAIAEMRGKCKT